MPWESCLVDYGDGDGVSLPQGFSLRSARDEDAERAAELVNEEARVHLGTPIWSTDQLLRHWSNPVVDRERDIGVVKAARRGTLRLALGRLRPAASRSSRWGGRASLARARCGG